MEIRRLSSSTSTRSRRPVRDDKSVVGGSSAEFLRVKQTTLRSLVVWKDCRPPAQGRAESDSSIIDFIFGSVFLISGTAGFARRPQMRGIGFRPFEWPSLVALSVFAPAPLRSAGQFETGILAVRTSGGGILL